MFQSHLSVRCERIHFTISPSFVWYYFFRHCFLQHCLCISEISLWWFPSHCEMAVLVLQQDKFHTPICKKTVINLGNHICPNRSYAHFLASQIRDKGPWQEYDGWFLWEYHLDRAVLVPRSGNMMITVLIATLFTVIWSQHFLRKTFPCYLIFRYFNFSNA